MSRLFRRSVYTAAVVVLLAMPAHANDDTMRGIRYDSVDEAWQALVTHPHARISTSGDWTIVDFNKTAPFRDERWAFAPSQHPAYPVAVLERVVSKAAGPSLVTRLLCESSVAACDAFFEKLKRGEDSPFPFRGK